jgi:osmotically-inducible protein OsmY
MIFKLPFAAGSQPGNEVFGHRYAGLRAVVVTALYNAEDIDASDVEVMVVDGAVVLEGSVPSVEDMDRAIAVAIAVGGVEVINRLWRCQH